MKDWKIAAAAFLVVGVIAVILILTLFALTEILLR